MKKVNKDPFSNGTEYMLFEERCCDKCIKHSHLRREGDTKYEDEYTKIVCSIERDIIIRMGSDEPSTNGRLMYASTSSNSESFVRS